MYVRWNSNGLDRTERQIFIDISGTKFPKIKNGLDCPSEGFWYVKDEFIRHSKRMLSEGQLFTHIGGVLVGKRWECTTRPVTLKEIALFVWSLRLFYMKSESTSIFSLSTYLEKNVDNIHVKKFFKHIRESWGEYLNRDATLICKDYYNDPIKTNKNLVDTLISCTKTYS